MAQTTTMIRLDAGSRRQLQAMAKHEHQTLQETLRRAIDRQYRTWFLETMNQQWAAIRADPKAWAEELAERSIWDATLMDGIEPHEEGPRTEGGADAAQAEAKARRRVVRGPRSRPRS